jgi:hypothetical protein
MRIISARARRSFAIASMSFIILSTFSPPFWRRSPPVASPDKKSGALSVMDYSYLIITVKTINGKNIKNKYFVVWHFAADPFAEL